MAREMAFGLQLGSSCLTFDSTDSTKNGYVSPNLAQTSYVSTDSTEGKMSSIMFDPSALRFD